MELPKIGQQCSQADCQQLDFLPLPCKCGKQFCSKHFNLHIQTCEIYTHPDVEPKKIENVHTCSRANCKETSLVPLICERCQLHFCIEHRHLTQCKDPDPETLAKERNKYEAPIRQFQDAKTTVDKQIEASLDQARKKGKNPNLANKVQLMKIKNKATGSKTIPSPDRVYFNVRNPKSVNDSSNPVFVSKLWSVGRAIDAIALECKLQNNNHQSTAKKLRLFKQTNGEIISRNTSNSIESLLESNVIADGESLVMEYVDDGCEHYNNDSYLVFDIIPSPDIRSKVEKNRTLL